MKTCPHCGRWFFPNRSDAKYCSRACQHAATNHTARAHKRAEKIIEFIGVDGESRPYQNTNKYHILSVGDQTLYRNGDELQFFEICRFLYNCFLENPFAAYVGFYLGYDFTYWLRSLPAERARMLFHPELRARTQSGDNHIPFPVEYLGWEFDLLGMKRFKLRPVSEAKWMYICDVGPFFQTSFLKAIDPSKWPEPVCSPEEYNIIVEGKSARGQETQTDEQMIKYNILENRLLSRLMDRMQSGYREMGIRIPANKWYGPGSAVNIWLNAINAPIASARATELEDALRASYYGGRFEITAHGPCGTLHEYDINSAYPDAMSELPMENGTWTHNDGDLNDDYCLVHADITGNSEWLGAAPHRERSGKSVCYPHRVRGWYWAHEIRAACDANLIADLRFVETYKYTPGVDYKPFAELRNLYDVRVKVGKDTPQGKAIKLVYNSGYGKVAQSVGQPKFANVLYASLITSHCRTKILHAIATHPKGAQSVAMIATDGIYFTSAHPKLQLSATELGKWSYTKRDDMFLIKPGMYFDGKGKVKSRGIGNRDLNRSRDLIRQVWAQWDHTTQWPSFQITPDFLVISPRAASHRGTWDLCGTVSTEPFTHSFDPRTKRYYEYPLKRVNKLVRTTVMPISRTALKQGYEVVESTPYDKRFGVELQEPGSAAQSGLISKTEGETIPMM